MEVIAKKTFAHGARRLVAGESVHVTAHEARVLIARGLAYEYPPPAPLPPVRVKAAFCVASGPSLTVDQCDRVRAWRDSTGGIVIVTNATFRIFPDADYLWAMDPAFWESYGAEVDATFMGQKLAPARVRRGVEVAPVRAGNSGAGALLLAAQLGARWVGMLGYDCAHAADGKTHFFGSHQAGLGDAGNVHLWPGQFATVADQLRPSGVECVNYTPGTALTCFERRTLPPPILIDSMHGIGDNIFQRAIVRKFAEQLREVYISTPVPQVYSGLQVKPVRPEKTLRTQSKARGAWSGEWHTPPKGVERTRRVAYAPADVRRLGGVLPAMLAGLRLPADGADFSMPPPGDARASLAALGLPVDRPIVVVRPLTARVEWGGAAARNPTPDAYRAIFDRVVSCVDGCVVVSIADVDPPAEQFVGSPPPADFSFNYGQLGISDVLSLISAATVVVTAGGMAMAAAQSLGVRCVSVLGGYERAYCTPSHPMTLKIEPIDACDCFTHNHGCGRNIDLPAALAAVSEFLGRI